MLEQNSRHKILPKLHAIYKEASGPLSAAQQKRLESINKVKSDAMVHAEKQCRTLCMGEVDYSPDLNTVRGQRSCWQMIVRKRSGQKVSTEKILRVAKAVGIVGNPLHTSITLREAKRSLKAADEEYRRLKANAPMMRQEFLKGRVKDETLSEKARKHAKQCLGHERQRDNARRMQHMRGKLHAGAVSKVGTGKGDNYQEYKDQATVKD
jgi:hypothetical protein